jgi:hypothetical protein
MLEKPDVIETKNLIFHSGSYEARQEGVARVRGAFLGKWPTGSVFTLSEHIGDWKRYLKSAQKEFPIRPKLKGQRKEDLSFDQLNDCVLDWVAEFNSVLVVLPEFDKLYRAQPHYFYEILGDFLAKQQLAKKSHRVIRFLVTFAQKRSIDASKIPQRLGGDWIASMADIEIVSLDD